jgi:hypothetical protein
MGAALLKTPEKACDVNKQKMKLCFFHSSKTLFSSTIQQTIRFLKR